MDNSIFYLVIIIAIVLVIALIIMSSIEIRKEKKLKETIHDLVNNSVALTTEEFLMVRNKSFGGRGNPLYSKHYTYEGVYILYNKTKSLYYVGQGTKIFDRVNNHFVGRGNGDVYADYKYGDEWLISMIALENSGFESLNELERNTIKVYNSVENGYNRTRGNRN